MKIQAVTFDVGGTLIEPWPSVGHVYAEVAVRHGRKNIPAELLNSRFKAAWRAQKDFAYTRAAWAGLVDQTFHGLCAEKPSDTFFTELYDRFAEPVAWKIFEDVLPAIEEFANQGIRLGIISNWDERLRILLRRLKLDNFFEIIFVSCEVGFAKPSAEIFERAAENFELPPASILHVGDSHELDFLAAKSAGLEALRICRGQSLPKTGRINSLGEVVAKLHGH